MGTRIITSIVLAIGLAAAMGSISLGDTVLFQENFNTFSLGTTWQATSFQGATGAPNGTLAGGVSYGGATALQMRSTTAGTEWKGIETINPISLVDLVGLGSVTLDVRTTGANINNASPIEVTLLGSSGEWVKFYYTYNAWTSSYLDSDGHSGAYGWWYGGTDPGQYRRWTLTVNGNGAYATVRDASDGVRWSSSFASPTFDELGDSVTIVLRQDGGNNTSSLSAYVDSVTLTGAPEPSTLAMLLGLSGVGLLVFLRRRRRS